MGVTLRVDARASLGTAGRFPFLRLFFFFVVFFLVLFIFIFFVRVYTGCLRAKILVRNGITKKKEKH